MTWVSEGLRGCNQVRNSQGSLLEAGTHVRVHDGVPGWGEALDRYGVIAKVNLGALKAYVRTKTKAGYVRIEDLIAVRGDR